MTTKEHVLDPTRDRHDDAHLTDRDVSEIRTMNVLFLCTGNSCRSILAEAIFRHLAPEPLTAVSAGSHPAGFVHPRALALLEREGLSTEGLVSQSWNDLPTRPDIVITLCASAAGETCPAYLGPALRSHWGLADPAKATGGETEIEQAFRDAYRIIRHRIETFLALPLPILAKDPVRLKIELDAIGALVPDRPLSRRA